MSPHSPSSRCPNLLSVGPDSRLRSLTTAIMPRGQKSKHRAREKRRQARAETQGLHDQASTSRGEETTSSSPPDSESAPSSSSAAGTSKGPQGAQGTTSAAAGAICKKIWCRWRSTLEIWCRCRGPSSEDISIFTAAVPLTVM